jgi:hypothetical protein
MMIANRKKYNDRDYHQRMETLAAKLAQKSSPELNAYNANKSDGDEN